MSKLTVHAEPFIPPCRALRNSTASATSPSARTRAPTTSFTICDYQFHDSPFSSHPWASCRLSLPPFLPRSFLHARSSTTRAARPPARAPPVSLCFACCLPATGQLGGAQAGARRGGAACAPARARWERRVRRPPPPPISQPQDRLLNLCRLQIRNEGVEKDHRAKFHLCSLRFCHHDHPLFRHPSGPSTGRRIHFEVLGPGYSQWGILKAIRGQRFRS